MMCAQMCETLLRFASGKRLSRQNARVYFETSALAAFGV